MRNKDTLARILARENIHIKHSNKGQLAFNPKTRLLTLPVYEDGLSEDTYDMLIGTSAAQVLYGPSTQELVDNALPKISKNTKQAKKVLNVMESIRTEKLVRGRYPGLSRIFSNAYKEILQTLKLSNTKMDELNILDRLNLSFKMGADSQVPFKKEEQKLVDLTSRMKTFQDAVEASRELLKFVEEEQEPPMPPQPCDDPDEDKEPEESDESEDSESNSKSKSDKQDDKDEEKDQKDQKGDQDDKKDPKDQDKKDKDDKKDDKKDKSKDKKDKSKDKKDKSKDKKDSGKDKQDDKKSQKEEKKDDKSQSDKQDDKSKKDEKDDSDGQDGKDEGKPEEGEDDKDDPTDGSGEEDSAPSGEDDGRDEDNGNGSEASESDGEEVEEKPVTATPANGDAELEGPDISAMIANQMQEFIDDKASDPVVGYLPDNLDPDQYIVNYKQFFKICEASYRLGDVKGARAWMKENDMTVSYMVQEFERKKRAALYVRRKTAKTGVIDTNKLVHALYSEDVFKRNTTVPEGKNHGMTFFLDWSGSMTAVTPGTIDQLLNLILFCRRARIAHEGYLFSDRHDSDLKKVKSPSREGFKPYEIMPVPDLSLIQVFSDQMTAAEFLQAVTYLFEIKKRFIKGTMQYGDGGIGGIPPALQQHSTPLDSSLIVSAYINDRMRLRCNLEVVKTCVITDGASNAGLVMMNQNRTTSSMTACETLQDRRTGTILHAKNNIRATGMMAELAAKRSNTDFFGFYLIAPNNANSIPRLMKSYDFELVDKKVNPVQEFTNKKFLVVKNFGFKEYYIINPVQIRRQEINAQNSLSDVMRARSAERVMLNRFIEQIADTN